MALFTVDATKSATVAHFDRFIIQSLLLSCQVEWTFDGISLECKKLNFLIKIIHWNSIFKTHKSPKKWIKNFIHCPHQSACYLCHFHRISILFWFENFQMSDKINYQRINNGPRLKNQTLNREDKKTFDKYTKKETISTNNGRIILVSRVLKWVKEIRVNQQLKSWRSVFQFSRENRLPKFSTPQKFTESLFSFLSFISPQKKATLVLSGRMLRSD